MTNLFWYFIRFKNSVVNFSRYRWADKLVVFSFNLIWILSNWWENWISQFLLLSFLCKENVELKMQIGKRDENQIDWYGNVEGWNFNFSFFIKKIIINMLRENWIRNNYAVECSLIFIFQSCFWVGTINIKVVKKMFFNMHHAVKLIRFGSGFIEYLNVPQLF